MKVLGQPVPTARNVHLYKCVWSHVSPQIESVVVDITKKYFSTEYTITVTYLSAKIDILQAQEQKLSTQITSTSNQ